MNYSHEVENMYCVAKGVKHGPGSDSGGGQVGQGERDQGYQRSYPWCRLVRTAAGRM